MKDQNQERPEANRPNPAGSVDQIGFENKGKIDLPPADYRGCTKREWALLGKHIQTCSDASSKRPTLRTWHDALLGAFLIAMIGLPVALVLNWKGIDSVDKAVVVLREQSVALQLATALASGILLLIVKAFLKDQRTNLDTALTLTASVYQTMDESLEVPE